ncbi:MAG: glycosyltransferase [Chitinivibrionales bacterium]|nr:glycosyltransferase [Chitinivibrionales bacterium]MBD3397247.1 glycosyltransferase [Chitinivibrionales bacterium]
MKISMVVPSYNEEQSLPELVQAIKDAVGKTAHEYEIVLVDDGSTDGSFEVAGRLHRENRGIMRVYRFSRNYGKSAALSVGIEKAAGDVIVTMDADLQDDPQAIPDMLALLEQGWDVVSGWKKRRRDPITKTIPSRFWNLLTSLISGIRLHDFNCGFKAYRAEVAKCLEIYGERHRYLPAMAHWDGFRVTEMIVPHHPRKYGRTKFGAGRFMNGILDMITLLFLHKYLKRPLHLFGLLGVMLGLAGSCVLGYFGVQWTITREMHIRPLVLLSLGAVIMGIQFISIGLIGEMITHANQRSSYNIRDRLE